MGYSYYNNRTRREAFADWFSDAFVWVIPLVVGLIAAIGFFIPTQISATNSMDIQVASTVTSVGGPQTQTYQCGSVTVGSGSTAVNVPTYCTQTVYPTVMAINNGTGDSLQSDLSTRYSEGDQILVFQVDAHAYSLIDPHSGGMTWLLLLFAFLVGLGGFVIALIVTAIIDGR